MRYMAVNKMKALGYLRDKHIIGRYCVLFIALFLSAINYNLFLDPLKIVTGGVNGLAILMSEMVNISSSILILVLSIVSFLIGLSILGFEKTIGALVSTLIYPFFVSITSNITSIIVIEIDDLFLISIVIGVITGIISGAICKFHLSQGGVLIISQSIAKVFKISVSKINFYINTIIVLVGAFFFGLYMAMYAIIVLYISSVVMNKIMLGVSLHKFVYIKTNKVNIVKNYITNELNYGITEFDGYSGLSGVEKQFLLTVVSTYDYKKVVDYVKQIDEKVFVVVTDAYQTSIK